MTETRAKLTEEMKKIQENKMKLSAASAYAIASNSMSPASYGPGSDIPGSGQSEKYNTTGIQNSHALIRYHNPEIPRDSSGKNLSINSSGAKQMSSYSNNPDFLSLMGQSDQKVIEKIAKVFVETTEKKPRNNPNFTFELSSVKKETIPESEKKEGHVPEDKNLPLKYEDVAGRLFSAEQSEIASKQGSTNNFTFMDSYRMHQQSYGESPVSSKINVLQEPSPKKNSTHKKYQSHQEVQLLPPTNLPKPSSAKAAESKKFFAEEETKKKNSEQETKKRDSEHLLSEPISIRESRESPIPSSQNRSREGSEKKDSTKQSPLKQSSLQSSPAGQVQSKTTSAKLSPKEEYVEMIMKTSPLNEALANLEKKIQSQIGRASCRERV